MTTEVARQFTALRERAERELAQRSQVGQIRIQVGSATCENAAGARELYEEFQKHIRASGRTDIVLHRTGCTGRCSCEPIVGVLIPGQMAFKYQRVDRAKAHEIFTTHVLGGQPLPKLMLDAQAGGLHRYEFFFCGADRCVKSLGKDYPGIFREKIRAAGIPEEDVAVLSANCFGLCGGGEDEGLATRVLVRPGKTIYRIAEEADLDALIREHILQNRVVERLRINAYSITGGFFDLYGDVSFFNQQTRLALRNSGVIDPESMSEYIACKGFAALATVLGKNDRSWVVEEMTQSKLRGRGGGGYPTGLKWKSAADQPGDTKYIICNADEGDPGAFMDRSMLEGDPLSVIEGMIIGGFAIGAHRGFFYVRAEYPLAVKRIETALRQAREWGFLGKNILGSGFDFDLEIRLGAGAFVCGEETALIHSIEGERGQPAHPSAVPGAERLVGSADHHQQRGDLRQRPRGHPVRGRVVPADRHGEERRGRRCSPWRARSATPAWSRCRWARHLREIVYDIGGGVPNQRKLKAIQTGGPAGGCIRSDFMDTPVDFDTLMKAGSIMGSGGMIVMDDGDCMVDIAKFFLTFSQNESCGKCTPCREGTKRMLEILEKITTGRAVPGDLVKLERLAQLVQKTSLCGLGRAAPNPVLSTLRYFREEYEAHVTEHRCPALRCVALISYKIDAAKCVGCTVCARRCPVPCITGDRRVPHVIDELRCIKCGQCFSACRFQAVTRN